MKKLLPYILILVIVANIFAPFTVSVDKNRGLYVARNQAQAVDLTTDIDVTTPTATSFRMTLVGNKAGYTSITFNLKEGGAKIAQEELSFEDPDHSTWVYSVTISSGWDLTSTSITKPQIPLKADTAYELEMVAKIPSGTNTVVTTKTISVKTSSDPNAHQGGKLDAADPVTTEVVNQQGEVVGGKGFLPQCSMDPFTEGTFEGCFVKLFYYILFVPTSFVFGLAGKFFDWAFAYSIMDTSYRSTFVTEGWGIMRDTCNLFFIFILIYAAFGMILSIHSIKAKEIVVNTIIIGLLINFSLFAGQVLIDASNILTRVFYNADVVRISIEGDSGQVSRAGVDLNQNSGMGELAISAALVSKVDPQKIIIEMSQVTVKDEASNETDVSAGTWFLVILMASAVNIVGLYVFFTVALLFIARVIGLWFALIFVPFAFFSYTVPQMQGIDKIGWKKWWPDTLGLCFMAPIFMFFMYLILMFLQKGFAGIGAGASGTNFVLSVMIPFIFIMMLLLMAKKLAVKYSGDMGAMITKAGALVGGVALGAGLGAVAGLGRATLGRAGNAIANSGTLKSLEARGVMGIGKLRDIGKYAGSGSMDLRGAKIAGKGLADTGLKGLEGLGKRKEGGFTKIRADKTVARQKRAEELKVGEDERLKQALNAQEIHLQTLLRTNSHDIEQIDKQIKAARENASDAAAVLRADPNNTAKQRRAQTTADEVVRLKTLRSDRKNAVGTFANNTHNGNISQAAVDALTNAAADRTAAATAAEDARLAAVANVATATAAVGTTAATAVAAEAARLAAVANVATATAAAIAEPANVRLANNVTAANAALTTATEAATAAATAAAAAPAAVTTATDEAATATAAATAATAAAATATANATAATAAAAAIVAGGGTLGRSINNLEDTDIPHAHHELETEDKNRAWNFAAHVQSPTNKVVNWLKTGGQHSSLGANEAAHKIRMGAKLDSGGKGGGHH